jgi:hypothetical protein
MTVLALIITAGLLARLILNVHAENRRLRAENASLRSDLMRADGMFDAVSFELREQWDRNEVLQEELVAYRSEEARRERAGILAKELN